MLLCYLCKASHDTGTFKVKRFKVEPCLSWIFSQCWYLGGIKWCTGFKVITRIIWWPDLYCSSVKKQILKNILAHIKRHIPRYRQMCDRSIIITKPSQYVGSYSCINKRYSTVQRSLILYMLLRKWEIGAVDDWTMQSNLDLNLLWTLCFTSFGKIANAVSHRWLSTLTVVPLYILD